MFARSSFFFWFVRKFVYIRQMRDVLQSEKIVKISLKNSTTTIIMQVIPDASRGDKTFTIFNSSEKCYKWSETTLRFISIDGSESNLSQDEMI